jgi:hypothetical protein
VGLLVGGEKVDFLDKCIDPVIILAGCTVAVQSLVKHSRILATGPGAGERGWIYDFGTSCDGSLGSYMERYIHNWGRRHYAHLHEHMGTSFAAFSK